MVRATAILAVSALPVVIDSPLVEERAATLNEHGSTVVTSIQFQPCWQVPVAGPVLDGYRPPACPWCPGNRGIEYDSTAGEDVRAPVSGAITFDGQVGGQRYLTIGVGRGELAYKVTIGGLNFETSFHRIGEALSKGDLIGTAGGPVHLGVRVGGEYVDPGRWLDGPLFAPRLVPLDSSQGRHPRVRPSCM